MNKNKKIAPEKIEDIVALTPLQQGMLFHFLEEPESGFYFEQLRLDLSGGIDRALFESAWNAVIKTNEMLRTAFRWEKMDNPVQIVLKSHHIEPIYHDLSGLNDTDARKKLEEIAVNDRQQRFHLQEPPFRVTLCEMADSRFQMIISNHHILYDGWSNGIILEEFFKTYHDLAEGKVLAGAAKKRFKEFVKRSQDRNLQEEEQFWRGYLQGLDSHTDLLIKSKKDTPPGETGTYRWTSGPGVKDKWDNFVKREKFTLAALLYSAWGLVLQKYNNSGDVVFGTTLSGRSMKMAGIEEMVGLFINTLPLRLQTGADQSAAGVLRQMEKALHSLEKFEHTPLAGIKQYSGAGSDQALFDTLAVLENYPLDTRLLEKNSSLSVDGFSVSEMSHYDLTLVITTVDEIELKLMYKKGLFEDESIAALAGHFIVIVEAMVEDPARLASHIEIISAQEKQTILDDFNATQREYPGDMTIHRLFELEVEKRSDQCAVISGQWQVTYGELDRKANALAYVLQEKGVGLETIVAIKTERSLEMVTGILAILKAGGVYLPIDPEYPQDRIDYMLKDSNAVLLLTWDDIASMVEHKVRPYQETADGRRGEPCVRPNSLAYIIYTSGSTGKPKGVMVTHRNVVRLVKNTNFVKLDHQTRVLQTGAPVFDATTFEIWGPLLNGGQLALVGNNTILEAPRLGQAMARHGVNTMWLSSPLFNQLMQQDSGIFSRVEYLLVGGDVLSPLTINKVRAQHKGLTVINGYGPTENTTFSTTYTIDTDFEGSIPIGTPIANSTAYIVDAAGELQPIGVFGELYVGGDGVSRGYMNNPELTAEKFVDLNRSYRTYKTGDLVRWLPDGNIEFLGRVDHQVKIRGFRVELGEIQHRLERIDGVNDAVVTVKEDSSGDKYLCAYIAAGEDFDTVALKERLSDELPGYMVPALFMRLDKIPLSPNGKVDRKALPEPGISAGGAYIAPRDQVEEKLVKIWTRVLSGDGLEQPQIGIDDDFFQLGGHSLKATLLLARLQKAFDVKLSIVEIFENPTIRELARCIRGEDLPGDRHTAIEAAEEKDYYRLSPVQERLYYLQQVDETGVGYNLSSAWVVEGTVDDKKLEQVFKQLILRHQSLRTSFHMIDDTPTQHIHQTVDFIIKNIGPIGPIGPIKKIITSFIQPYDLAQAPLLRVGLANIESGKHLLIVDMHHIISDGASTALLINEFTAAWQEKDLPRLTIHYKDYSEWQRSDSIVKSIEEQGSYWLEQFAEEAPILNLPLDYPRPVVRSFEGKTLRFHLDKDTTQSLKDLALDRDATLFMVLVSIYTTFLAKISNQEDIVVGTPVANRGHADLESVIGMFVNTLPLRNFPASELIFTQFLEQTKQRTLGAFDHQDYPFSQLVEAVVHDRSSDRNPLFDAMFVLQNQDNPIVRLSGLTLTPQVIETDVSKFDITMEVEEKEGQLHINLEYCSNLFKPETIQRFTVYFENLTANVLENPERSIGEIEIIGAEEKEQVLIEFNNNPIDFPQDKTIHKLFEEQAVKSSDQCSVISGQLHITYGELNRKANALAAVLGEKGVGPDTIVALQTERSVEMVIGILGILKSGGAYLAIDPESPQERIDYMLNDSNAALMLTSRDIARELAGAMNCVGFAPTMGKGVLPDNLAYIIYTSGTTGKPKGVMVNHKGIANLGVFWAHEKGFGVNAEDRVLQFANVTFDASVTEFFMALFCGAALVMVEKSVIEDHFLMEDFLLSRCITVVTFPPPYLTHLDPEKITTLRKLITAGSEANIELMNRWKEKTDYINAYGPTEITICATCWHASGAPEPFPYLSAPIGPPIFNTQVYILDKNRNPQPLGVAGELYAGGVGVTRGYMNRPELTAEKFVYLNRSYGSYRTYKTGDLARWLPDGNIEFLGRSDHQVKIRGFRVELSEIEHHLMKHPAISQAVVIADTKKDDNDKYICAYYVSQSEITVSQLRDHLGKGLPAYMIPAYFAGVEEIPLTPSGKVDRKKLPQPEIQTGAIYAPPRDKTEAALADIWMDVLSLSQPIGIDDDFFHLGGHSLKATALAAKIHKVLDVKVPLGEILKDPTIRGLSRFIKTAANHRYGAIAPAAEKEYYPLSSTQKRLYFIQQMDEKALTYNMPASWILESNLDEKKLAQVFKQLVRRHESFRTSFHLIDDQPVQVVHDAVDFSLEEIGPIGPIGPIKDIITGFIQPFDLAQAPLLRVGLVKIEAEKHLLMVDMHHIIGDGVSMRILAQDFMVLYAGGQLPDLKLQYKDYAQWQAGETEAGTLAEQEAYWLDQFKGEPPVLELPTDYARPAAQGSEGSRKRFDINSQQAQQLHRIATQSGGTLYSVLLTVFNVFLAKITGQEEIAVGTAVANRGHSDLEQIIGMFVNTLVLVNNPGGEKPFDRFLAEVNEKVWDALEHQDYPFEELVEKVAVTRDAGRNPLFDVMFDLQPLSSSELSMPDLNLKPQDHATQTAKFDLLLQVVEEEQGVRFFLEYSTHLFKESTIERFTGYFKKIITAVTEAPNIRLSGICILSEKEKQQILHDFNDTKTEYPGDKVIHQLFVEQATLTPDAVAVTAGAVQLTYSQLKQSSGSLAQALKAKGVVPGAIVGLKTIRSLEMVIGILAILEAGGAYLPIDPGYPEDRILFILNDSSARILLNSEAVELENRNGSQLEIFELIESSPNQLCTHSLTHSPTQLCYIIYTSGSTGKPKGVMVEHRAIMNTLLYLSEAYPCSAGDNYLLKTSFLFDVSVTELLGWFLKGGRLTVLAAGSEKEPEKIVDCVERHRVTHINFVPSMFNVFVQMLTERDVPRLAGLKYVFLAGEALWPGLVEEAKRLLPGAMLENIYGPTEAAVYASGYSLAQLPGSGGVPIGKPLANVELHILDRFGYLQPIGIPGELIISGAGLARGYMNRPELTASRFVDYRSNRSYKTGDLCKWLPDGNIQFLGRIDHQVKIRGFRIELGEIENRLMEHDQINDAVLRVIGAAADKSLCAYYVSVSGQDIPIGSLKEHLSKKLPDYMIPGYFVHLEHLPLTATGKVDRKALPAPEVITGGEFEPPRDEIGKKLAALWSELLEVDEAVIGVNSDFFQLGGHSLKATLLSGRLNKVFNVSVPVAKIFSCSTIGKLTSYIKETDQAIFMALQPAETKGYYNVAPAQRRMYLLQQMDEAGTMYNIPSAWILEGDLDQDRLEKTFKLLIQRHESLRTSFHMMGGQPVQMVHDAVDFSIEKIGPIGPIGPIKDIITGFIRAFDLDLAPLLRVGLVELEASQHLLMVDMHHIVSDGVSVKVFINEFMALYSGEELAPVRIQYKDYSENLGVLLPQSALQRQEAYWLDQFKGEIPVLDILTDFQRPSMQDFTGSSVVFGLDSHDTNRVKELARTQGSTVYMTLLAAYNIFLAKLGGQEDIIVGTPIVGRKHSDLEQVIGMFVGTLALRNYPSGDKTLNHFLEEIKERTIQAFENQDYPFEELVEKLDIERDAGRNPLFDVMFTFQDDAPGEMVLADAAELSVKPYSFGGEISKFDLTLSAMEIGENLYFSMDYASALFKESTIKRYIEYFKRVLARVVDNPDIKIAEISIISDEEKKQILVDFNDTEASYPHDKTIHQLFREQAEAFGDRCAVVSGRLQITYRELSRRVDRLAHMLRVKGVGTDTIVGLKTERGPQMIIGILGILEAGGAYLPIDLGYPEERVQFMLKDSNAKLLLTGDDISAAPPATRNPQPATGKISSTDLAYIIYTSGSTGKPKGVLVTHTNVVRLVKNTNYIEVTENDRLLQVSSYAFDASVFDIYGALTNGAALVLTDKETVNAVDRLAGWIKQQQVSISFVTTALFNTLVDLRPDCFENVRKVLFGGERVSVEHSRKALELMGKDRILHVYGPTETAVYATYYPIDHIEENAFTIPIGGPISNTTVYILDKELQLAPIGVSGEVYIGGPGTARGYLNRPELTAEKFADFYGLYRTYKTGDLARWLPDGNIEFLGRIDHQVKIRGFRIETGEIESCLLKNDEIESAVVLALQGREGDKYLCAYFVSKTGIPASQLRAQLAEILPEYMIPSYFIQLDQIPLNTNGKVDRGALPAPEVSSGVEYVAPGDETEKELVRIWSDILGIAEDELSIDANFFEIGGHSLKATTLVHRIYKELEQKIKMQDVFNQPTIRQLAQKVRRGEKFEYHAIAPVEEREYYPLSYAQRRLWVLCQFEEDSIAYNIPMAANVTGELNIEALGRAMQEIVNRQESLRTLFKMVKGSPYQFIVPELEFHLEVYDIRELDDAAKYEEARKLYRENANLAFDLEKGPLFLLKVIRLEDDAQVMVFNIHHIVSDGWSMGNFNNEIITLYNSFLKTDDPSQLPALELQYKDYSRWHNGLIAADRFNSSRAYWLEKFRDKPNGIELPLDRQRKAIQTFNGGTVHFDLEQETARKIQEMCFSGSATLFMGLLTMVNIFLYRYTGQQDIIIGSPIANRKQPELHSLIGFFANTLVFRNKVDPAKSFQQLLQNTKEETLACYENQDFPFDLLVEGLELERDMSQSPIFNVMVAHNNSETEDEELVIEGLTTTPYAHSDDINMSKFDLTFFIEERDEQVFFHIEYNSDLFDRSSIQRMADSFLSLSWEIAADSEAPVSSLNILRKEDYKKVIGEFNQNCKPFGTLTLQELFEQQAEKHPDKTAVVSREHCGWELKRGARFITYGQLNQRANRLAGFLMSEHNVKPNDIIGISMDRGIDMIVVIWGIIKSGAGYLAVDPTYPRERVLHVLDNSRAGLLITDRIRPELYGGYTGEIIEIAARWPEIEKHTPQDPPAVNQPGDVLYVNYTSGSTGTPNGAMLSHDCLTNLIQWQNRETAIDCSLRVLQFTSVNFCVSFQEIIGTLTSGGQIHLIGDVERQDTAYLMDFLSRNRIQVLFLPFSYLNFLFTQSNRWTGTFKHSLQHIITAGEQLKITSGFKQFLDESPRLQVHNHYGSTEMHVVTSYTLDAATAEQTPIPPAGKPISNVKIYILDEHLNPVPIGVWGELMVVGDIEILGYINNDELTGQKLVHHPVFSKENNIKLYRSGDIGRWLPDGNIELRGRKDFMVKIRGFRIELGEVESKILSVPQVRECVVVPLEDQKGQKSLFAYVSVDGIDAIGIKRAISNQLPMYMIPQIIVLDSLPLMHNGKVDRSKLPEPDFSALSDRVITPPSNDVEEKLAVTWSQLLETDKENIGIDDNFFELGGHSLKATVMVSQIYKELGVEVQLADVFTSPTIRDLAAIIGAAGGLTLPGIPNAEKREYYPLSYNQQRMVILHQMDPHSPAYNMPGNMHLEHAVEETLVAQVLDRLFTRHQSFRTAFRTVGDEVRQFVLDEYETPFEVIDISALDPGSKREKAEELYTRQAAAPFDLSRAPLFRVKLVKLAAEDFQLMFCMHHIISDGWSLEILKHEFGRLYDAARNREDIELPPLPIQYIDFSQWHNRHLRSAQGQIQAKFWKDKLAGGVPVLQLPADREVKKDDVTGAAYRCMIGEHLKNRLKDAAVVHKTTLFNTMFSIYTWLLHLLTGENEIGCSFIAAGRNHPSFQQIIGFFVNSVFFKIDVDPGESFEAFIKRINRDNVDILQDQSYPLESVFEELGMRYPDVPVSFNMLNLGQSGVMEGPGTGESIHLEQAQDVKFDLEPYVTEYSNGIEMIWVYKKNMFNPNTIEYIVDRYIALLEFFAQNPGLSLDDRRALVRWDTDADSFVGIEDTQSQPGVLVRKFEDQVNKTPAKIAVKGNDETFTYSELNRYANGIARLIGESGAGEIVGLLFGQGAQMIAAILGALKAGKTYVPLTADYPRKRLSYMLEDSQASLILTGAAHRDAAGSLSEETGVPVLCFGPDTTVPVDQNPYIDTAGNQNAYILYTSGSTGQPKGVVQTHANVDHFIRNWIEVFSISWDDNMTLFSSFGHDASVMDIYSALHSGATLFPLDMKNRESGVDVSEFLAAQEITVWHSVPSLYSFFAAGLSGGESFPHLRLIVLGGEAVRQHEVDILGKHFPHCTLANLYGQTETSFNSVYLVQPHQDYHKSLLGSPLPGTRMMVCDGHGVPVQPLETGEIVIAGGHVSPGYWNKPGLTAERYVEPNRSHRSYRSYKTGDLGRLWIDGSIEFLGRKDHQVKIRGFRIEPGEVESRLLQHPGIIEAVVTLRRDAGGDHYLCAHLTAGAQPDTHELREFLAETVPDYMIPARFMYMEKMPLTPTGKIDRNGLPEPGILEDKAYTAPRNETERKLVELWSGVLARGKESIGTDSDFFDLGGHSLRATILVSKIHKEFGIKMPLAEVFRTSTVKGMAEFIGSASGPGYAQNYIAIEPAEQLEYYAASSSQERFYILQQMTPESTVNNITMVLRLKSEPDKERLEGAFRQAIHRHESLRTSFHSIGGRVVQRIHETVDFQLEYIDLTTKDTKKHEEEIHNSKFIIQNSFVRAFDLAKAPLVRVGVVRVDRETDVLVLDMHHIISDGTSNTLLGRELMALYDGESLPPLRLQYKDYTQWQHSLLESGELEAHEEYWLDQLKGPLPELILPRDYPEQDGRSNEGHTIRIDLGARLADDLSRLTLDTGTTLYMVLLAAFNVLLYKYTGQEDIIVGSPIARRDHADLQDIIGLIMESIVIRSRFPGNDTFTEFLEKIKDKTLTAYDHQAYPHDELLKKLDSQRDTALKPVTRIGLILQNMDSKSAADPDHHLVSDASDIYASRTSKLDLTVYAWESVAGVEKDDEKDDEKDITLALEYNSGLFKQETIQRLSRHFVNILEEAVTDPGTRLSDFRMMDADQLAALTGGHAPCCHLSHPQKRIHAMEKAFPGTGVGTLAFTLRYPRLLDKEKLEKAVNYVLERHEGLRLRMVESRFHPQVMQYVSPFEPYELETVDFSGYGPDSETRLQQWLDEDTREPFRFLDWDLFYFAFIRFNEKESGYYMKVHHIVADGWTAHVLFHEIDKAYRAFEAGSEPDLAPAPSYIDYFPDERRYFQSPQAQQNRQFWHDSLIPLPQELDLSPGVHNFADIKGRVLKLAVPEQLRDRVLDYCRERKTSIYKLMTGALSIYFFRITGNEDMVMGSASHNRTTPQQKQMAGMFVSTIPIRIRTAPDTTFEDLVGKVGDDINRIIKNHQQYPFDRLMEEIRQETGVDPNYLLNVNLIGHGDLREGDFKFEHHFAGYDPSHLTIHVNNKVDHELLELEWVYQEQRFTPERVERMHRGLVNILEDALTRPSGKLSELDILTGEEKEQILHSWNDTGSPYTQENVCDMFRACEERFPDNIAVTGPNPDNKEAQITYRQLHRRADQLAQLLQEKGVGPETIVAIKTGPSVEMIIGLLGILKSGGAYLPINPETPSERIDFMLKDSNAKLMLTDHDIARGLTGAMNCAPTMGKGDRPEKGERQEKNINLAYIIYTSGSTGRPKAVAVEHGNLRAYLHAFEQEFHLDEHDVVIQQVSFAFDAFVEEFYPVLLKGGKLAIPEREQVLDTELLCRFIWRHRVSMITCSPLLLNELNKRKSSGLLDSMRIYISGADRLNKAFVDELIESQPGGVQVYNTYGPTEATVCATYYRCSADSPAMVPIGAPIANYKVFVMDKYGNLLPPGVGGELCIAGPGVTRGYLNNPELTAEKFTDLNRPYGSYRSYKTGDLCQWLPNGDIEFLGRIDQQVKVRGFRIELEEIENRLLKHQEIKEAVVTVRGEMQDKSIYAYIVPLSPGTLDKTDLRDYLAGTLPAYMIPDYFVQIKKVPLTPNGKVDRKKLPAVEGDLLGLKGTYVAPNTQLEQKIAAAWMNILGLEKIGLHDNFFQLGGNSLKVTELNGQLRAILERDIPMVDMFKYQTIHSFAGYLTEEKTGAQKLEVLEKGAEARSDLLEKAKNRRMKLKNRRQRGK